MNSNWLSHGYDRSSSIFESDKDYAFEDVNGDPSLGEHDCRLDINGICQQHRWMDKFNEAKRRDFR